MIFPYIAKYDGKTVVIKLHRPNQKESAKVIYKVKYE